MNVQSVLRGDDLRIITGNRAPLAETKLTSDETPTRNRQSIDILGI